LSGQAGIEAGSSDRTDTAVPVRPVPLIDDVEPGDAPEVVRAPTLGEVLRAERERQGMPLDEVERATCVRAAQLRAIEEDRLDSLPAEAYARGFVRTYAEQLSLDPDAMVDLFNRQWSGTPHDDRYGDTTRLPMPVRDSSKSRLGLPLILAVLLLAGSIIIYASGAFRGGNGHAGAAAGHTGGQTHSTPPPATGTGGGTSTATTPPPAAPAVVHMRLLSTPGTCWIQANRGSATGALLASETLQPGQVLRLHAKRIWLRIGAPSSARLRVNGRLVNLTGAAVPVDLLLTPHGAKRVA
jgi:helix-turn-helix protein/uncharacterized protein DUF4115